MLQRCSGSLQASPWCHHCCFKPCPGWGQELQGQIWCHTDKSLGKMHDPPRYIFLIDRHGFEELKNKHVIYCENAENKQITPQARQ